MEGFPYRLKKTLLSSKQDSVLLLYAFKYPPWDRGHGLIGCRPGARLGPARFSGALAGKSRPTQEVPCSSFLGQIFTVSGGGK